MAHPDDEQIAEIGRTLAHPLRVRILRAYRQHEEPRSPTALATEVDLTPATLAYHVRELDSAGMLELVETHRRRGATERSYRLTTRGEQIAELADQLVGTLGRRASAAPDAPATTVDLTPLQRQLLSALLELGADQQPIAPDRIGEHLGRQMRGTGPALSGLERRGLAQALRLDPHRRWWRLTAEGIQLGHQLAETPEIAVPQTPPGTPKRSANQR